MITIRERSIYERIWDKVCLEEEKAQGWTSDYNPGDHTYTEIEPIRYNCDLIDAVLVYADGTVEFHCYYEEDAYNWANFPDEVNEEVYRNYRYAKGQGSLAFAH